MTCAACRESVVLDFDFTMAFQPIVDVKIGRIWGYEALVRGTGGEPASQVLNQVTPETRYRFDQDCRVKAIELAAGLFRDDETRLSINFLPNAVYEPAACIQTTLRTAARTGLRLDRIMFEFTENEQVHDADHLQAIIDEYRRRGFVTAIDDFGAGFSGLNLLADFTLDLVKIDMGLIRGIDTSQSRRAIVSGITSICRELGIILLAEGIETEAEMETLKAIGIELMQGYYFSRPEVERLPVVPHLELLRA